MNQPTAGTDVPVALKVGQVARLLQISRGSAYEAIRRGDIPSVRVGRSIRVSRSAIERMMDNRRNDQGTSILGALEAGEAGA
jgi:excisionase family DNA binding protein